MAGVKGRSGRKSWDKELEAKALWDLSIPVLKKALKSEDTTHDKKIEIAQFLIGKMLPNEIKGISPNATIIYSIIQELQRDFKRSGGSSLALANENGLDEG